ncbi:MAG: hypothetical protein DRP01_02305 [Archaeoglobales archaeon]|nr:MAG: hypothetical protein DRP01_02305 [Archaeoglobales archaeon]
MITITSNVRGLLSLMLLVLSLIYYIVEVSCHATAFKDLWILDRILSYFLLTAIMILILTRSGALFENVFANTIFTSILIIGIVAVTPIIKYLSPLAIYGTYDALAHYSFSKWILINGKIAQNNELYYSFEYGFHPGNGLIPTFISLLSNIPLDIAMSFVMLLGYIVYVLVFHILLSTVNINVSTLAILFGISTLYFYVSYCGTALSYPMISLIILKLFRFYMQSQELNSSGIICMILPFTGLMLTHYASTIHVFLFFTLVLDILLLRENIKTLRVFFMIVTVSFVTFVTYEVYVDAILSSRTIIGAINRLRQLYLREIVELEKAMKRHENLTPLQLVMYLLASRGKPVILMMFSTLLVVHYVLKKITGTLTSKKELKNSDNNIEQIFRFLTITSALYLVSYAGVSSIGGVVRTIPFMQSFLALLLIDRVSSLINNKKTFAILLIPFILIGFISNYNLNPLSPILKYQKESYRPIINTVISPYIYMAVEFINSFATKYTRIVTLNPYITFGYSDLIWNADKFPARGFINTGSLPEESVSMIKSLLSTQRELIIPLYLTDRLSGRPGLKSYYLKPFELLTIETALIYNNRYYALFYTINSFP